MKPNRTKQNQMVPDGTKWNQMEPNRIKWNQLKTNETFFDISFPNRDTPVENGESTKKNCPQNLFGGTFNMYSGQLKTIES